MTSGPTEYMTELNSYPLRIEGMTMVRSGAFRGHQWAEPSGPHLRTLMRRVATPEFKEVCREIRKRRRADLLRFGLGWVGP
jgi:hypothetical protein